MPGITVYTRRSIYRRILSSGTATAKHSSKAAAKQQQSSSKAEAENQGRSAWGGPHGAVQRGGPFRAFFVPSFPLIIQLFFFSCCLSRFCFFLSWFEGSRTAQNECTFGVLWVSLWTPPGFFGRWVASGREKQKSTKFLWSGEGRSMAGRSGGFR